MWSAEGEPLADGFYARWIEEDLLHVEIRHELADGRVIEESAAFAMGPPVEQRAWSWTESREGTRLRRFEVDFGTGAASVERLEDGETERDGGEIEIEPGSTFAGFGFALALQSLRERLVEGEVVELGAVTFFFGPRVVGVEVSHGGAESMRMGGREVTGDRFDIEPQIPGIVDIFVEVPTTRIWLTRPPPAEFLRFEGPVVEPDDPVVRIDLLPGPESGAAEVAEHGQ
jgi:hypothetical protein